MPKRNYGKIKASAGWEKLQESSRGEQSPPPQLRSRGGWDHLAGHVECCHELGDGVVVLREWVSRLIIRSAQAPLGGEGQRG